MNIKYIFFLSLYIITSITHNILLNKKEYDNIKMGQNAYVIAKSLQRVYESEKDIKKKKK